jgi:hypothetical protein
MIVIVDDATKRVLHAELGEGGESAVRAVLEREGLPMALYTDRAHWAAHTPTAGGGVDRQHPTQVGRALARLGIEHILGYSPQARGRSERANRTLQGRLVNELRLAGITTVAAANRYLHDHFLPAFNAEFGRPRPTPPPPSFLSAGSITIRSSASRPSASWAATTSSRPSACPCHSPNSRGGAPAPGSGAHPPPSQR